MKESQNEDADIQPIDNMRSTELQMEIEEQDAELDLFLGAYDNLPTLSSPGERDTSRTFGTSTHEN